MNRLRRTTLTACLIWGLSNLSPLAAQAPLSQGILDVSPAAQRLQTQLQNSLEARDWDAVFKLAETLVQQFPNELFELQPDLRVNGRVLREQVLRKLPAEGQRRYFAQVSGDANALWQAGLLSEPHDLQPQSWSTLIERHPGTPDSLSACLTLGDRAWKRGDLPQADFWWEKGLSWLSGPAPMAAEGSEPIPSTAGQFQVDLLVRVGMSHIVQGRFETAREIQRRLATAFPEVPITLGGLQGPCASVFDEVLSRTREEQGTQLQTARELEPIQKLWETSFTAGEQDSLTDTTWADRERPRPAGISLSFWREALLLTSSRGVQAWNTSTGKPAWPAGITGDTGTIYEPSPSQMPFPSSSNSAEATPGAGVISDRYWIGTVDAPSRPRSPGVPQEVTPQGQIRLICLDLQAEGRLHWAVDSRQDWFAGGEAPSVGGRWVFTSAPSVQGETVAILLRAQGSGQGTGLLRLHRDSGEVIGFCQLLTGTVTGSAHLSQDEVLVTQDQVYCLLGGSWLVAVSETTNSITWARRLNAPAPEPDRCASLTRLLSSGGALYFCERHRVTALDASSGQQLWQTPVPAPLGGWVSIYDHLLLAAGNHLWGIHASTGRIVWRAGGETESPAVPAVLLTGGTLLWGADQALSVLNPGSGELIQQFPLDQWGLSDLTSIHVQGDILILSHHDVLTAINVLWQARP